MNKEEKVAEGIYITKPNRKPEEKQQTAQDKKFVYKNTAELIAVSENQFGELAAEVDLLYKANEGMLEFDPMDYDLIQAREDNLVIINKRLTQMKEMQDELKIICPNSPIVALDVFSVFLTHKENEQKDNIVSEIDL